MMVSSISTSTRPACSSPPVSCGAWLARPVRNRQATASSWRTWPKVNVRRNEPSVEAAYALANTRPIPPWRSSAMSSIESAPATNPATRQEIDPKIGSRLINARVETLADKPSWRAAFRKRRAVVPARGYFEWAPRGAGQQGSQTAVLSAPGPRRDPGVRRPVRAVARPEQGRRRPGQVAVEHRHHHR